MLRIESLFLLLFFSIYIVVMFYNAELVNVLQQNKKEYKTIKEISGPLVFVEKTEPVSYGELVQVSLHDGTTKRGQVLDTSHEIVVVQIFEGSSGINKESGVKFLGETIKINLSKDMLGRIIKTAK